MSFLNKILKGFLGDKNQKDLQEVKKVVEKIINDPTLKDKTVGEIMDKPMQVVALDSTLDVLSSLLNKNNKALLVRDDHKKAHIITQHDILKAMTM